MEDESTKVSIAFHLRKVMDSINLWTIHSASASAAGFAKDSSSKSALKALRVAVLVLGILCCFINFSKGPIARRKSTGDYVAKLSDNDVDSLGSNLELRVPFYIYETPELNWSNATLDGKPYIPPEPTSVGAEGKHSDDFYLLQGALNHPMRTFEPERAQLFFVPTLLNSVLQLVAQWRNRRGKFCTHGRQNCFLKRDQFHLFTQVNKSLSESPWFRRSDGKDHLIVASHWHSRTLGSDLSAIHMCNSLIFEDEVPKAAKSFDRYRMPSFYIGKACPLQQKTKDFAMIASLKHDDPTATTLTKARFRSRKDICDWLSQKTKHREVFSVGVCGRGKQCPALARAKYGFHVRGDTWGSNRLMDTMLSHSVPLFTSHEQYKILPPFFPWREVSYLVNISSKDKFLESINHILSRPQSEYLEKIQVIKDNIHILDHKRPYQFDLHMADLARKLGLQT